MTIKEKLESIKGKKIAIWCEEEWMADELFKIYEDENPTYWNKDMCYDLEESLLDFFLHADKTHYESIGFEIVNFTDFVGQYKNVLSQSDINAILDEKYGKDNWVVK